MRFKHLPFVQATGDGQITSTWSVQPSGDYALDCATGREHFHQLLGAMTEDGTALHLSRVIEGQVRSGQWSGVEVGFHAAMAEQMSLT